MSAQSAFGNSTNAFSGFITTLEATGLAGEAISNLTDNNMGVSSGRTVYMDSNIAITSGSGRAGEASTSVIPSVYHALVGLQDGVKAATTAIGNTTLTKIGSNATAPSSVTEAISQLTTHTSSIASSATVEAIQQKVGETALSGTYASQNLSTAVNGLDSRVDAVEKAGYLTSTAAADTYLSKADAATDYATSDHTHDGTYATSDHTHDYLASGDATFNATDAIQGASNIGDAVNKLNAAITNLQDKEISSVEALMYATTTDGVHVLSPGNGTFTEETKAHAKTSADTNLRLKAKDIEFEIPAPFLTGYKVTATGSAVDANTGGAVNIAENDYWIPIETTTDEVVSTPVASGKCGRVIRNGAIQANHCRLSADLAIDVNATQSFTPDGKALSNGATIVYNLGAIIEAIQELNRRTMFMDTDMSFAGAIHYGDVTADIADAGHEGIADGLPGASNANLHHHATA